MCPSACPTVSVRPSPCPTPVLFASFHACLSRNIQLTSHSATHTRPVHNVRNVNNIPSHSMYTISAAYATYNVSVRYTAYLMCKYIAASAALPVMCATRPFLVCVKTLRILVYICCGGSKETELTELTESPLRVHSGVYMDICMLQLQQHIYCCGIASSDPTSIHT